MRLTRASALQPEVEATAGAETISLLPTWSTLYITINNATFGPQVPDDQISNWTQTMSITDGIVTTAIAWSPAGDNSTVQLNYTVYAHRSRPNLGVVRLDVSGLSEGLDVSFTDVLDGIGALRTEPVSQGMLMSMNMSNSVANETDAIYSTVSPLGYPNITAVTISRLVSSDGSSLASNSSLSESCVGELLTTNASTASQCFTTRAPATGSFSVVKWVGIASTDAFPGTEMETANNATQQAIADGYDAVLAEHREAWNALWDSADIIIPGEEFEELQIATRASMFHILSALRNGSEGRGLGDNSLGPAGLTSDSYAGLVFWDADVWVMPGLNLLHPEYAESIVDYRFKILNQSMENARQYNRSGVLYAWTSGRTGKCTGTGPCADYVSSAAAVHQSIRALAR